MNIETEKGSPAASFEEAWSRVKTLTGWTKQGELAAFMGTSAQSVYGIKSRGKFPIEWAYKLASAFDSFTDWILLGVGPMRRSGAELHANGNGIVQGHQIEAQEIHIDVHQPGSVQERHEEYLHDPVQEAFLKDWLSLSDVGKMRVWTMLKEEMEREKERGK